METQADAVAALAQTTLQNTQVLIGELEDLDVAWKKRHQVLTRMERKDLPDLIPGWHDFIVSVKGTSRSVQRLLQERNSFKLQAGLALDGLAWEEQDRKDVAKLQSCGFKPHQLQWDVIKRTHGLLAFSRRFSWKPRDLGPAVDAVVQNGTEWLKILTVTDKKLHMQMAEEGWHPDDSSDDESSDSGDDDSGIQIINLTMQLVKSARANRCNTRTPRIHFVLPNITSGKTAAIDKLLRRVRSLGKSKEQEGDVDVAVDCADSDFLQRAPPPLWEVWENLFRDTDRDRLTPTLNLELTFLLSLASDITHADVERQGWYSLQSLAQIEDELHAPGVRLQGVYSMLRGRSLECTQSVAREARNVVDDLGTETSKARLRILFGCQSIKDADTPRSRRCFQPHGTGTGAISAESEATKRDNERKTLISQFRELSKYPVPDDLKLPIQVVGEDEFDPENYRALIEAGELPAAAAQVFAELDRPHNRSCHLWGWKTDNTTLSSNCLTVRMIESTVDKARCSGSETGPRLYITSLAISINTAQPCPSDKWEEIREAKHLRKQARNKEAKQLKASGAWGPSLGVPAAWDQKQLKKQESRKQTEDPSASDERR